MKYSARNEYLTGIFFHTFHFILQCVSFLSLLYYFLFHWPVVRVVCRYYVDQGTYESDCIVDGEESQKTRVIVRCDASGNIKEIASYGMQYQDNKCHTMLLGVGVVSSLNLTAGTIGNSTLMID